MDRDLHSQVAVVILNYNGHEQTIRCIESIVHDQDFHGEIVVCDNGSIDGSCQKLEEWMADRCSQRGAQNCNALVYPFPCGDHGTITAKTYGEVFTLIRAPRNLGYAGGNNIAIRYLQERGVEYILLLNNDLVVRKNTVNKLVEVANSQPNAGLVGALNVELENESKVYEPGMKFNRYRLKNVKIPVQPSGVDAVDKVIGSSILIKSKILDDTGLMDERFFLYWEDLEFCLRVKKSGYVVLIAYDAVVEHSPHGSSNGFVRRYFHTRNAYLFVRIGLPKWYHFCAFLLLFSRNSRSLLKLVVLGDVKNLYAVLFGVIDGLCFRSGEGRFRRLMTM